MQVILKNNGRYRVIKSFGPGITEAEVVRLEEKARQHVRELTGTNRPLFENGDEIKLEDFLSTVSNSQVQVIGPESIFGTLYDRIGHGGIDNELFRHLVPFHMDKTDPMGTPNLPPAIQQDRSPHLHLFHCIFDNAGTGKAAQVKKIGH